jgi:hypothetical protein
MKKILPVSSPVYIEDAAAAVAWVFNNINEYDESSRSPGNEII